jgi:hypothetical protein
MPLFIMMIFILLFVLYVLFLCVKIRNTADRLLLEKQLWGGRVVSLDSITEAFRQLIADDDRNACRDVG